MLHSRLTWLWNLSSRWCHVTVTHHSKQPHYYYTHTPHAFVRALTDLTFYLLCRDLGKSKPSCCFKSLLRVTLRGFRRLTPPWVSVTVRCRAECGATARLPGHTFLCFQAAVKPEPGPQIYKGVASSYGEYCSVWDRKEIALFRTMFWTIILLLTILVLLCTTRTR